MSNDIVMWGQLLIPNGAPVHKFKMPIFLKVPEVVMWGTRFFIFERGGEKGTEDDPIRYTEGLCWPIIDYPPFGIVTGD